MLTAVIASDLEVLMWAAKAAFDAAAKEAASGASTAAASGASS